MKEATTFVEFEGQKMVKNPAKVFRLFLSLPAGKERMEILKEYNEWIRAQ